MGSAATTVTTVTTVMSTNLLTVDQARTRRNEARCRCQTDDLLPTQYDRDELYFGDDCSSLIDQECGDVNCIKCSYSWPRADPLQWESPEGACRCEVLEGEPMPDDSYKPLVADVDGVDTTLYV